MLEGIANAAVMPFLYHGPEFKQSDQGRTEGYANGYSAPSVSDIVRSVGPVWLRPFEIRSMA